MTRYGALLAPALVIVLTAMALLAGCPKTEEQATAPATGVRTGTGGATSAESPLVKPDDDTVTIAMIPKLIGIDFFNACQRGAEEAAKELGVGVELIFDGPTEAKVERQIEMIESFIDQGVDVIAVAANDPEAIAPSLAKAASRGVMPITWDSDANPEASKRVFFANQATPKSIGRALVDEMARQAGEDAKYAIISGTPTASNQNIWMNFMAERQMERYPKMEELTIEFPGEDQAAAMEAAQGLLKRYPDIDGIFGITSVAFPGAVEAVVAAGKQADVAVVGLATPKAMKEWVLKGDIGSVVLWNAVDLGYLTVQAAVAARRGDLKVGDAAFAAGRLGELTVDGDQVILGEPLIFTKDNIEEYDF